jgi:hypothetical protein
VAKINFSAFMMNYYVLSKRRHVNYARIMAAKLKLIVHRPQMPSSLTPFISMFYARCYRNGVFVVSWTFGSEIDKAKGGSQYLYCMFL